MKIKPNHIYLMPKDMAADIIINNKSVTVNHFCHGFNVPIKIAPREGKIPTNQIRENCVDVRANPRHHPTGRYGLNYDQELKLSLSQY